jgi:hypothetical protein
VHPIPDCPTNHALSAREAAETRLRQSCYSALRRVSCDDRGGVLHLFGQLPSHYLKQLALHLVREAAGSVPIEMDIEVNRSASRTG